MDLLSKKCVPCEGGVSPLGADEVKKYLAEINSEWVAVDSRKLKRDFTFRDFKEAMAFVNRVAQIAEAEGHHPDIHVFYNKVTIELWTHAAGGLTENDFIIAAKIST